MASSNEEQVQKVKNAPIMEQNKKSRPQKNNDLVFKNTIIIPILAIIIALGALSIATYTFFLNKQLHKQLFNTKINFSKELKKVEQNQQNTQEQTNAETKNATQFQTQIQTKFDALNQQVQSAMNQRFYQNQDWLLLKARYYLELAQINAHWSNEPDSTISPLEQADQLLKQLNEPKIFTIRQVIATDIAQIQAIPPVDIAGLLSQLDATLNNIKDLSISLPGADNQSPMEQSKASPDKSSSWNVRLEESMNILGKLIVIRRHDQEIKPLLSPLLEAVLKEKLRLNIQEAQWAVLNHDSFVYQLVMKQAINTLKTNFNQNTPTTASLIKKLMELQQMNVTQKKPTLGSELPMLNEFIERKKIDPNNKQGGNE